LKILAIADEIDPRLYSPLLKERFGDVSLVLSCGDLPFYYLEFIVSTLNVPLLYVRGNHAHTLTLADGRVKTEPEGCINLDGRVLWMKGVILAGLEGSMRYSEGPHQYTERQMRLKALRLVPGLCFQRLRHGRYLDILVTHAAPYGIHDGQDRCHRGFRTFLWLMEKFRPQILVHGHMHVYTPGVVTESWYRKTRVVNAFRFRILELNVPA
jgi:Icc-related predicted phosphoesterase